MPDDARIIKNLHADNIIIGDGNNIYTSHKCEINQVKNRFAILEKEIELLKIKIEQLNQNK